LLTEAALISLAKVPKWALVSSLVSFLAGGHVLCSEPVPTLSLQVNVVNLLATVRDKQGRIVGNLTQEDFRLEEDGRPQEIRYFSKETDLPLTLGLLVDTSLSQRRVLGEERSASFRFLDQVLRENKDMAFVIHFDREVELLQDLTWSRQKLESTLEALETPPSPQRGGANSPLPQPGSHGRRVGTLLYDAVFLASDELMKKQQGRKALVVLSDGVDNGSKETLADAIKSAHLGDTLVYSILFADQHSYSPGGGYGGPHQGRHSGGMGWPGGGGARSPQQGHPDGKKILERLSQETGGGFFEVSSKQSIKQIFGRIEEELRNQYSLGYTPDSGTGGEGYRKIRLTATQKDLRVQTRDGYYLGRQPSSIPGRER
jgi:VWFA-related protein